ncbi:MAG: MBL fold metallo-hydrolase [Pseudomonadota bacterium]
MLFWCLVGTACTTPAPSAPPHHQGDGFRNHPPVERPGFTDFLRWQWERPDQPAWEPPTAEPRPLEGRDGAAITWIGHATALLEVDGRTVLTDPVFSDRASPLTWLGPRRYAPPRPALKALPAIDVVVISHNHYDALDAASVEALAEAHPGAHFFVPLGLADWFRERGIDRVTELDWWESAEHAGLTVTATPVQHWSKRGLFDENESLWAGWAVEFGDFDFWFAGDTGYQPVHFRETGRRLGPFDLAAIPIGAYAPRWFMKSSHVTPEEAVRIRDDVGARRAVAIHWGTFPLTDEPPAEPAERLRAARNEAGLQSSAFHLLRHGETWRLSEPTRPVEEP